MISSPNQTVVYHDCKGLLWSRNSITRSTAPTLICLISCILQCHILASWRIKEEKNPCCHDPVLEPNISLYLLSEYSREIQKTLFTNLLLPKSFNVGTFIDLHHILKHIVAHFKSLICHVVSILKLYCDYWSVSSMIYRHDMCIGHNTYLIWWYDYFKNI